MDESDDEYVGNESGGEIEKIQTKEGVSKRTRHKTDKNVRKKKGGPISDLKGSNGGYSWEDEYQRSWDIVKEDEGGSLQGIVSSLMEARKKRFMKNVTPFQRGIIRTIILVLDASNAMVEKDLRPNRYSLTISYAIDFVTEFFDQNPISQLGIVVMRNGIAQLISEVSGNPHDHIEALKSIRKVEPKGDPSLQNALEMARGLLLHVASHCTREILMIFGALLSSDPGDIHKTIKYLVDDKVRVRIIGLAAQVAICKDICKKTNYGDETTYGVILNETHFKDLLMDAVTPLAFTSKIKETEKGFTLVKMGFPSRISETVPSFCSCHSKLIYGGYICSNCKSKVCSLPTVCPCCSLMLILSTHLARSYHHLFPMKSFDEVPLKEIYNSSQCFGCQKIFPKGVSKDIMENTDTSQRKKMGLITSSRYRCKDCFQDFCIDCDVFIHETLHNCPGCESSPTKVNLEKDSAEPVKPGKEQLLVK